MKIKIISLVSLVFIGGVLGWLFNAQKYPDNKQVIVEKSASLEELQELQAVVAATDFVSVRPAIAALPEQAISAEERRGLIFMREEEKLARDVYSTLYDKWGIQIFSNIAQSEQTHTEAVRTILAKYNITDPVTDDSVGVFVNNDLQKLYNELVAKGNVSIVEALTVGAIIEDQDIADLQKQITLTDNADIKLVYENLLRGSRNHLRSFFSQLESRGVGYTPKYINQAVFEDIVTSARESGSGKGGGSRGWGKN